MNMVNRRHVAIALFVIIASAGIGYAVTSDYFVGSETHLAADDGPEIVLDEDVELNAQHPFPDENTIDLSPHGTVESDGETFARVSGVEGETTEVKELDVDETKLVADLDGKNAIGVEGNIDSVAFQEIDLNSDETEIEYSAGGYDFELTIFDLQEDTTVLVRDASDDEEIGSFTSDSDGTLVLDDLPSGTNEIYLEDGPDQLEIRDEETEELIESSDGDEVEVRFFPDGDDEVVETRTTEDGIVDFAGLPSDEEFVITVSADGYETRSVYIDSILDQQTVYLLDQEADSVLITFDVNDRTEQFRGSDVRLVVQKPVGTDNQSRYQNIAGEYFGAAGEQSITLERGERYRLTVFNRDGQSRSLGSFTPESDDFITLDIGNVEIGPPDDQGFNFRAVSEAVDEDSEEKQISITYRDYDEQTDQLRYRIKERHNDSNVLQDWVTISDAQEHQNTIPLDEEEEATNWVVEYEIDRGGDTITDRVPVGGVGDLDFPISGEWLAAFGMFAIVGTASLFGGALSRTGAVMVSIVAFGLTLLGVVAIPYPALILAGAVAIIFKFAEQGQGGFI